MGRSYKRKTKIVDIKKLQKAILEVGQGMPLREASRLYGVPRTSLRRQTEFNRTTIQSIGTQFPMPADAIEPLEQAVPFVQRQNEFFASPQITDIIIRNVGRKSVCLSISFCMPLLLSYFL